MPKALPVIHVSSHEQAIEQACLVRECGADGVFLISHHGDNALVVSAASYLRKNETKDFLIGINLLGAHPYKAFENAVDHDLDMVWADHMGVDSSGVSGLGMGCSALVKEHNLKAYASIAFKYQPIELSPTQAAINALECGFIPTTSGARTGTPPSVEKIDAMSKAANGCLAVASGLSADNVSSFTPYLSDMLVSTSISDANEMIEAERLADFLKAVQ